MATKKKIKAVSQPKGMPNLRWTQLKNRAEKERSKAGTAGGGVKRYQQALKFYVGRWEGKAPDMPKSMTSPGKNYPRKGFQPKKRKIITTKNIHKYKKVNGRYVLKKKTKKK